MTRKLAGGLALAAAALLATPAPAQEGAMPEMTPEQKAMMEAYQKAGTPGPEHQAGGQVIDALQRGDPRCMPLPQ